MNQTFIPIRTFADKIKLKLVLVLIISVLPFSLRGQTVIYLSVSQEPYLVVQAGSDIVITKGEETQLGGNPSAEYGYGTYTYLWTPSIGLSDPTLPNPIALPDTTTIYTLTVTDGHNCMEMDEVEVTVRPSSSIDQGNLWSLELYPNPVDDQLIVKMSGFTGTITFTLLNTLGNALFHRTYYGDTEIWDQIDTKWLTKGFYFLRIQSNQVYVNHIVIKQ